MTAIASACLFDFAAELKQLATGPPAVPDPPAPTY